MADDQHATPSRTDYTVHKGEVSLAVYRKHVGAAPGQPPRPVLFLVHGSSNSALSSFDPTVPGAIPIILGSVLPRRMGAGAWTYQDMAGYTSVGVGSCILPVRLNCPPEITLHRLLRDRRSL